MDDIPIPLEQERSPFLRRAREIIRTRGLAYATEKTYLSWIRRFILFINKQHPKDVNGQQVSEFLSYLAVKRDVSANTQKTALNAIAFLYRDVIGKPLQKLSHSYAKLSTRIPTVFTHAEACRVIAQLMGVYKLLVELMYGAGLRVSEVTKLRVQDIDFVMNVIILRNSKGNKDSVTLLPNKLIAALKIQFELVRAIHKRDLKDGVGDVYLPNALSIKYPNAPK